MIYALKTLRGELDILSHASYMQTMMILVNRTQTHPKWMSAALRCNGSATRTLVVQLHR